jgi:hypothetical protein
LLNSVSGWDADSSYLHGTTQLIKLLLLLLLLLPRR